MWFEDELVNNDVFQILKVKSTIRESSSKVIINAVTWKSWLHVRPSTVLAIELNKLKDKYSNGFNITFVNKKDNSSMLIYWAMDILAMWLRVNTDFDIMLEWEDLSEELITDLVNIFNWLETHNIAGCESVPTAINRILWTNLF